MYILFLSCPVSPTFLTVSIGNSSLINHLHVNVMLECLWELQPNIIGAYQSMVYRLGAFLFNFVFFLPFFGHAMWYVGS